MVISSMKAKTELAKMRDKVQRLESRCERLESLVETQKARIDYLESMLIKLALILTEAVAKHIIAR